MVREFTFQVGRVIIKVMNQRGSVFLILLFTTLLSAILFVVGFYFAKQKNEVESIIIDQPKAMSTPIKNETNASNKGCSYYGYISNQDDYLPSYTVKKGDTIASLAKRYLGSIERSSEIIELNKDRYQNLYVDSFLEIGWRLHIPPFPFIPAVRLSAYSGEVIKISNDYIVIDYYDRNEKYAHPVMKLKKDPKTQYFVKNNFNVGDCVGALVDSGDCMGEICDLIAVAPEDSYKKYFTRPLEEK